MTNDPNIIRHPLIKTGAAWGCAGVANVAEAAAKAPVDSWQWLHAVPWGSLASMAAFLCSLVILCEALWKKVIRPLGQHFGWLARESMLDLTESQWADMHPGKRK